MEAKFDPYSEWLGIRSAERPVNHYDLLGLPRFESDSARINEAALSQSSVVRKYQLGIHSDISQRLLNEISAARICLLDAEKRKAYDAKLNADELTDDELPVAQLVPQAAPLSSPSPLGPARPLQSEGLLAPGDSLWANRPQEPGPLSGPILYAVIGVPLVIVLGLAIMVVNAWVNRAASSSNGPTPVVLVTPPKPQPKPNPQPAPQPKPLPNPLPLPPVPPPQPNPPDQFPPTPAVAPAAQHPASPRVQFPDNQHHYQRIEKAMSWHEARDYCKSLGGYLATATTPAENQFLYENFGKDHVVWLGATDEIRNGDWKWITGEPWSFQRWAGGEPSNHGNKEHYLAMGICPGVRFMGQSYFYRFGPSWNDHEASGDFWHTLICYPLCEWDQAPAKLDPPVAVVPLPMPMPPPTSGSMTGSLAGEERRFTAYGLVFCWCPPGKFPMGSPASDPDRRPEEEAPREAKLAHGFWISQTEVTKDVMTKVLSFSPWQGRVETILDPNSAACHLSHFDAKRFTAKLNALEWERTENPLPKDWEYRLPFEPEWEYACRAESTSTYWFGNRKTDLKHYAWFADNAKNAGQRYAHLVGQKKANAWNLFDMTGNVAEYCLESEERRQKQPNAPALNIARGGHFESPADQCRSAARILMPEDLNLRPAMMGLRLVLSPTNLPADSIQVELRRDATSE